MDQLTIVDVGVERFNTDHERLLFYVQEFSRLAKRFGSALPLEDEWDQLDGLFPRLEKFTQEHFQAEESLMREYNYPLLDEHRNQHLYLIQQLDKLQKEIKKRQSQFVGFLETFLVDWLQTHINQDDLKYRGFFQQEETQNVIDKALFNEMISASQLHLIVQTRPEKAIFLDIRTTTEHQEGIIPHSQLFPCEHNLENRQDTAPFKQSFYNQFHPSRFEADTRYFLICRSGPRTEIALESFLQHGLMACELIGGIEEWKRQGYPVEPVTATTLRHF